MSIRAVAALALSMATVSAAADYGSAPCDAVGRFAAAVVHDRNAGVSQASELKKLRSILGPDDPAYSGYRAIVRDLYSAQPWAKSLSEAGAQAAYASDCQASRP